MATRAKARGWRRHMPSEVVGVNELVAFTVPANTRSQAVMHRLGMTHDPSDDFDHPGLPAWGARYQRHVLYRLSLFALASPGRRRGTALGRAISVLPRRYSIDTGSTSTLTRRVPRTSVCSARRSAARTS